MARLVRYVGKHFEEETRAGGHAIETSYVGSSVAVTRELGRRKVRYLHRDHCAEARFAEIVTELRSAEVGEMDLSDLEKEAGGRRAQAIEGQASKPGSEDIGRPEEPRRSEVKGQ